MNLSKLSPNEFLDKLNNLFKLYTESNDSSFNDMFIESCDDSTESKIKYLTATEFLERVQNIVNMYMSEASTTKMTYDQFKEHIKKYSPGTVFWKYIISSVNPKKPAKYKKWLAYCIDILKKCPDKKKQDGKPMVWRNPGRIATYTDEASHKYFIDSLEVNFKESQLAQLAEFIDLAHTKDIDEDSIFDLNASLRDTKFM